MSDTMENVVVNADAGEVKPKRIRKRKRQAEQKQVTQNDEEPLFYEDKTPGTGNANETANTNGTDENMRKRKKSEKQDIPSETTEATSKRASYGYNLGPTITPELISYFLTVGESFGIDVTGNHSQDVEDDDDNTVEPSHNEDDDEENELELMLANVLKEAQSHEYRLAVNKRCSRVLEYVVKHCSILALRRFLHALLPNILLLAVDRNAAHVVEKILRRTPSILLKEYKDGTQDEITTVKKGSKSTSQDKDNADSDDAIQEEETLEIPSLTLLFKQLCENIDQPPPDDWETPVSRTSCWPILTLDEHATFFVRSVISILSGYPLSSASSRVSKSQKFASRSKSSSTTTNSLDYLQTFDGSLKSIVDEILRVDDSIVLDIPLHQSASPTIQIILSALHTNPAFTPHLESIVARLLLWTGNSTKGWSKSDDSDSHINALFSHRIASHFMEKIIEVGSESIHEFLYKNHIKGNLNKLSLESSANFVLQRLFEVLSKKSVIKNCLKELRGHFETLLKSNRGGVVWKLCSACARLDVSPVRVVKSLRTAVHADDKPAAFVQNLLSLYTTATVTHLGSCILQALLSFKKIPPNVTESLLALPTQKLENICNDKSGSHVIDVLFGSTLSIEAKRDFTDKLAGSYARIASNVYGSFAIENFYKNSDLERKKRIAAELIEIEPKLLSNANGRALWSKCHLTLFKTQHGAWLDRVQKKKDVREIFADILQ